MNAAEFLQALADAGAAVWRASWQASVLAALVFAVQLTFGRRMPARWRHTMWLLVLVRLALPVVPSSPLSVFNLAPQARPATPVAPAPDAFVAPTPVAEHSNVRTNVGMSVAGATVSADVTAPAVSEPPPMQRLWMGWSQVLAACWLAGAVLLALRITWATLRVSRMMRRLDRVTDPSVLQLLRETAGELRVRRLPVLLTGDGFFNPALVGFIRPRLLLLADLLRRFEPAELRLVLLHELAHLKRRDVAVNWFATLLTVLHWPNPVAWLVAWRLRLERELACDELVMSVAPADADRRAYGHTIVKLLETFSRAAKTAARPMPGAVGILEGKQQMKRRITMIAQFTTRARAWTIVAAVLVLGLGLIALTDAVGAEPPTGTKEKAEPTAANKPADPAVNQPGSAATIGPDELVTVSIMDLVGQGVETVKTSRVDADGNINLPYVGAVKANGQRSGELEKAVAKAFKEKGLMDRALVVVSLPGRGESHTLSNRADRAGQPEAQPAAGKYRGGADPFAGQHAEIDPAIAAVLDKKLPEVVFEGIGFSDVVDFLRDVTASNIFVDWRALEEAGIDRNAPVTVRLRDVAFKNALAIVLRGVNPELYYNVENNVIQIGWNAPARAEKLEVKTYDAGDVLGADAAGPDVKVHMSELVTIVRENVQPATWQESGGNGKVNALGTRLVVTASESVHHDVDALLKTLRENPAAKPAAVKKAEAQKAAEKMWKEKYWPRIISVGGQSNTKQVKDEFEKDIKILYPEIDVKALKVELPEE